MIDGRYPDAGEIRGRALKPGETLAVFPSFRAKLSLGGESHNRVSEVHETTDVP